MKKYLVLLFLLAGSNLSAQVVLPVGSNPPAIEFSYFPNTVYAVIWRNWNLVEPARIAKTIHCKVEEVNKIAASMGLSPYVKNSADFKRRMYITVIRRNWHLLPYDQLLTLLNMSAEELEYSLREDDFLFIKLGGLKPKCSQVIYSAPDPKALARAKEIKQLEQRYFKKDASVVIEPRFNFVKELKAGENLPLKTNPSTDAKGLRFIYSYFGVFGDPLINTSVDPYPDGLLARLAAEGINGVWMHVVLNQMAPGGKDFPEFGSGYSERTANLRKIVDRAKKYGIKVYLYMNEPRAMPVSFFKNRPDMAGVREGDLVSLCTSNQKVKDWITNSLTYLFKQVPGLGGVFTITGSENLTNCASHGNQQSCPNCSKRSYADIIADVNKTISDGVLKGNPDAKVIVWDWGWNDAETPAIIARLPKSVWFMSVSEWGQTFERGGISSSVGEYSISVLGPGTHAKSHWEMAKKAGLKTVSKVQFNNTWELSAIPWIPVLDLVAKHASNLASEEVDGAMLSWSLGGYPSPNLEIAKAFAEHLDAKPGDVLDAIAIHRYGKAAAPFIRKAWTSFSTAFQQFPFSANVLYKAPQQYGSANLLFEKPTGYTASMVGFPYDDLNGWLAPYTREVFVKQFDILSAGWKKGLADFKKAVNYISPGKHSNYQEDLNLAQAAYCHFASVANQAHFIIDRDSLLMNNISGQSRQVLEKEVNTILDNEISLARDLYKITCRDSRVGFEASNQYYYVPQDLMEKVINCEFIRKKLEQNIQ